MKYCYVVSIVSILALLQGCDKEQDKLNALEAKVLAQSLEDDAQHELLFSKLKEQRDQYRADILKRTQKVE